MAQYTSVERLQAAGTACSNIRQALAEDGRVVSKLVAGKEQDGANSEIISTIPKP